VTPLKLLADLRDSVKKDPVSKNHVTINKIYATVDHDLFMSYYEFMPTIKENTIVLKLNGNKY